MQARIIYFIVAMAGPLISKYIYTKIINRIQKYKNNNKDNINITENKVLEKV